MPKLLDQVCETLRLRHYRIRPEEAYVLWVRKFILFHEKRHPLEMGEREVGAFLTYLAVERDVAAATQNQVRCALLFRDRTVLARPLEWMGDVVRA